MEIRPAPARVLLMALILIAAVATTVSVVVIAFGPRAAEADEARTSTELKLASGQKLVDVSWRCFGDYPCRPFVLTRAMRKDEAPETYALSSPYSDASDAYVIKYPDSKVDVSIHLNWLKKNR